MRSADRVAVMGRKVESRWPEAEVEQQSLLCPISVRLAGWLGTRVCDLVF